MTFSAYVPSITEVVVGTKYVLNGNNNENYKMYIDAYDDSVTNAACINDIVNLVVGEGLFSNFKDPISIISDQDVRLIVQDYETTGQASLQIVWLDGKPVKIYHVPIMNSALDVDSQMKVKGYWYCYDWSRQWKYKPEFYPKFSKENPENKTQMMIIKRPSNEPLFSKPHWFSALRWAQDEGLLAQHSYSDVKTGFSGQKIINWAGGRGLSLEQKDELSEKLAEKFSGINGKRTVVSINNSVENSVVVDNIDPVGINSTYVNYTEEAERKILIAHSYPSILLAGSKTGFSSNADEIAVSTKSVMRRKINPDREVILSHLLPIFKAIDPAFDLRFKNFDEENLDNTSNTSTDNNQLLTGDNKLDEETLKAQASLKGSVGGVQALLEIQASYSAGTTSYDSAINMLDIIYGYNKEQAIRLLGKPKTDNTL